MKKQWLILFFIVVAISKSYWANAQTLDINKDYTVTYFASNTVVNIQDAIKANMLNPTTQCSTSFINEGLVSKFICLRVKVTNKKGRFIEFQNPRINLIKCYIVTTPKQIIDSIITGDYLPFATRKYLHSNFVFQIPTSTNDTLDFYFLIDHRGSTLQLPINVYAQQNLEQQTQKFNLLNGIVSGVLLIAFCFGIFLFAQTKKASYWLYALYVACCAIWLCATNGFLFQYFFCNYPMLNNRVEASFGVFISAAFTANALSFTKPYYTEKQYSVAIVKGMVWLF